MNLGCCPHRYTYIRMYILVYLWGMDIDWEVDKKGVESSRLIKISSTWYGHYLSSYDCRVVMDIGWTWTVSVTRALSSGKNRHFKWALILTGRHDVIGTYLIQHAKGSGWEILTGLSLLSGGTLFITIDCRFLEEVDAALISVCDRICVRSHFR